MTTNGEKEAKRDECEEELLDKEDAKKFIGLAARVNFIILDCPDLQVPIKDCSREMANPCQGSWGD